MPCRALRFVWSSSISCRCRATHGCSSLLMRRKAFHRGVGIFVRDGRADPPLFFCDQSSRPNGTLAVRKVIGMQVFFRMIAQLAEFAANVAKVVIAGSLAVGGNGRRCNPRPRSGRCKVADRTMIPGGVRPKNVSIRRSVTWSYFAPPMPCMNRSHRARRAQSVVIKGPRTDSHTLPAPRH